MKLFKTIAAVFNRKKDQVVEAVKEMTEEEKAKEEERRKLARARIKQDDIAYIHMCETRKQTIQDPIVGEMEIIIEVDKLPTCLKAFKCSMEYRKYFPEYHMYDTEIGGVVIFARDMDSIIDYMKCLEDTYYDGAGFIYRGQSFMYDGMVPLKEISNDNIMWAIRNSSYVFIIDSYNGNIERRKREAQAA